MDKKSETPLMDGALLGDEHTARKPRPSRDSNEDAKAEDAADALREIMYRMDIEADVNVREEDDERIVLDVDGPDAGRAIGKKGQTLDALQFLVNKIVNRFPDGRRHIVVDSGDYRDRHDQRLVEMAKQEAEHAIDAGKVVTLRPMTARDRRVVHMSLADLDGIRTESSGEGMGRRIQIIPDGVEPRPIRGGGGGGRRRRR
ncbi:MAG: KH domain-containing protein [Myxococcales bacterium]|nr:KH domain-containing protein [Myxococcales bacterium]